MKKIVILLFSFIIVFCNFDKNYIHANENVSTQAQEQLAINSPSGILIEFTTGSILFEKNSTKKMYPASMTKMMPMYMFLESIENGSHTFDEIVQVSTLASSMGGSQIFLKENERMSFEDLFKAVTIASANDAVVALAEHTYGSLDAFIKEMNNKAKEFKMNSTNFTNVTGFHDPNHYTTAYDMGILAQKLLKDYGDVILKYSSIYETYLREDTSSPFWLVNTNRMLKFYNGMDGLKTGYTSDSGFNLTATAKRNGMRLISVIMGGETSKQRNQDTSTVLDYGFNTYKIIDLYKKGETILTHSFINSKSADTPIIVKEDVGYLIKKNENPNNINVSIELFEIEAPLTTEDIVGRLVITNSQTGQKIYVNLYSQSDIKKLTFIDLFLKYIQLLLT